MATVPAVLGSARLGNFRLGYEPTALAALRATKVLIFIAGVESRARVRVDGFTIHDALNDDPNTCSLTVDGSAPVVGQALRVTLNTDTPRLLFNGTFQTVALSYEGKPANWAWDCTAIDDLARLNRRIPFGTWVSTSASTVAPSLIGSYAPGFTATNVQAGLAAVTLILDGTEGFSGALRQIAQSIGGYFYVEDLDLHLFLTEATDTPDPIQVGNAWLDTPPIAASTDISQLRTRVYGKGHGEAALVDVPAGESIIPIANTVMFNPTGGLAIIAADVIGYTGMQLGGSGSLVGPSAAPSVAPTLTAAIGAGLSVGFYASAYTFVTASGESLPSPVGTVGLGTVATPPSSAPTVNNTPSGVAAFSYNIGDTLNEVYTWSAAATLGDYSQMTAVSPATTVVVVGDLYGIGPNAPLLTIPMSPDPLVTFVLLWRQVNGGGYKYTTYATNVPGGTWTVRDGYNPSTALPAAYLQIAPSGIAIGPAGTTQRKYYRTTVQTTAKLAAAAALKLQQTIANNTATVGVQDATPDGSLGAAAPVTDTSGLTTTAGQVNAGSTSLLTSGTGAFSSTGGWASIGEQIIRYTGLSGNSLTGIPVAGVGALINTARYGEHVDPVPALTGVVSLDVVIPKGQDVNIWVQRDDFSAQASQAALDGGDGIYEYYVADERRGTASLNALCDAHLALYSRPIVTVTYATRDVKTKSGKTIVVNLSSPPISQTLTIQDVTITEIDVAPHTAPKFTVSASTVRQSLESILRRMTALLD